MMKWSKKIMVNWSRKEDRLGGGENMVKWFRRFIAKWRVSLFGWPNLNGQWSGDGDDAYAKELIEEMKRDQERRIKDVV